MSNTSPKSPQESELSRDLSLFHITMLGVGMMIGAGVFVLTGIGIGISGPGGILLAFALNGLVALTCTMAYAELASAMPEAGGGYTYVREGIGGSVGFLSGWMSWLGHTVAGSLYAIAFATYSVHFFETLEIIQLTGYQQMMAEKIIAVLIALMFIYINYRGASETGLAGSIMALGQMAVLGAIGIIGLVMAFLEPARLSNFQPFLPAGWGKILVTMGFTYIGFEGYEVIAQAGEEVQNPKRNIPKAIFLALLAVVTTYLLVSFAALVGVTSSSIPAWQWIGQHGSTGFARAIGQLLPFGGLMVTLAAIFSSTSALNATTYSSTRVSFALGRDRYLPKFLSRISENRKVPDIALFLSGFLIVLVAATLPVEDVAASADIMFLLLFLLVNISVIKIRQERGNELEYGYLTPLFPIIPIMAIIFHLILSVWLFDMSILAWMTTIVWLVVGTFVYFLYSRHQEGRRDKKVRVLSQKRALKERGFQILLPIANPEHARYLMKYASAIAKARDAEILVLSMVTVPEQTPLSEASKFVDEKEEAINEALNVAPTEVPIHSTIRYGHDVARGIISAVKEHGSDLLVLGWGADAADRRYRLGSIVDPVVERSPCDSIVIKPGVEDFVDNPNILCAITGGLHSYEVVKIARWLIKEYDGSLTLFHVSSEQESEEEGYRVLDPFSDTLADLPDVQREVVKENEAGIADRIVERAEKADLVLIGATREGIFEQIVFGSIPEEVARRTSKTVIMAKKHMGIRSWLGRWFGS